MPARRRASELPPGSATVKGAAQSSGIVCTNTDLLSIMNSLKSTANKALQQKQPSGRPGSSKTTDSLPAATAVATGGGGDLRRDVLRNSRSNSVDVANIGVTAAMAAAAAGNTTRNWFRKMSTRAAAAATTAVQATGPRGAAAATAAATTTVASDVERCAEQRPVTIGGGGEYVVQKSPVVVTFADERPKVSLLVEPVKPEKQPCAQPPPLQPPQQQLQPVAPTDTKSAKSGDVVVWDRPTGSVVNAEVLGTAIEGFLAAKKSGDSSEVTPSDGGEQPGSKPVVVTTATATNEQNTRTCDTSICSSLKDLFVK